MRTITLTKGQVALVDDEDYEALSRFRWHAQARGSKASNDGATFYAMRRVGPRGAQRHVPMQAAIMHPPIGADVDHRNGDTLDNRRENLRITTVPLNRRNRQPNRTYAGRPTSSRYKGVSWHKGRWEAAIAVGGVRHRLGRFVSEEDAAAAYDRASRELHGDFGRTNT